MLEKLNKIEWSQLSHAHGEATDVPDQVRALASSDTKIRHAAIDELCGNIWHQGSVYEATPHAVPFLIELLQETSVSGKPDILHLLREVSRGSSCSKVHGDLIASEAISLEEFETLLANEKRFVAAAHSAVLKGVSTYLQILADDDVENRKMALYVLGSCAEESEEIGRVLLARWNIETDDSVKAASIVCLQDLAWGCSSRELSSQSCVDRHREFVRERMFSVSEPPVVRFVAACYLVQIAELKEREEVVSVLKDTWDAARPGVESLPWMMMDEDWLSEIEDLLWEKDPNVPLASILKGFDDSDSGTRIAAINDLAEACRKQPTQAPMLIPHLVKQIRDPDIVIRSCVEHVFGRLEAMGRLAVRELESLVNHPNARVGKTVTQTLERIRKA